MKRTTDGFDRAITSALSSHDSHRFIIDCKPVINEEGIRSYLYSLKFNYGDDTVDVTPFVYLNMDEAIDSLKELKSQLNNV